MKLVISRKAMTESFLGEDITFFFLPDFRSDQKLEGFGLSAFQKKVLQTHKLLHTLKCIGCIILRHLGVTREQIKEKKNEKKEKASSVCFQNSGWKSSTEYLSYAQGSLVHTEFNWHFTLKSHHKVTPGNCTCVFIPCRAISKLGRTSAEL